MKNLNLTQKMRKNPGFSAFFDLSIKAFEICIKKCIFIDIYDIMKMTKYLVT